MLSKSTINMAVAVIIGGLAVEFLVNKTPVGDFTK